MFENKKERKENCIMKINKLRKSLFCGYTRCRNS